MLTDKIEFDMSPSFDLTQHETMPSAFEALSNSNTQERVIQRIKVSARSLPKIRKVLWDIPSPGIEPQWYVIANEAADHAMPFTNAQDFPW